ncbi:MAG TPA: extracellular solute-binding protein [Brachybacterium massiliense]|uniref:Extracellular solute-binding protein n=1 Tax=Brachybacterium massiliense TaxID=1755098 RepID=A0A921MVQ8_9MICO|nr:extracellular solute-binding protein [Brachybacterium massiliense]
MSTSSASFTRRGALAAGAVGATALGLAACGGSGGGEAEEPADVGSITGQTVRVWFMEGSISDEAIAHLEEAFKEAHPENSLVVEIQPWDGIDAKLQTSLASASESPDLVETGNTNSSIYTSIGAFAPLDDIYEDLGGDDLIQSFVEAGRWDDQLLAVPLYAGARGIFYRQDLFEAAGIGEPTTLDELADAVIALGEANPEDTPGFSGMYLAAVDIHGCGSLMFAGGGSWAEQSGDAWEEKLSDPATKASLERITRIFAEGTAYAQDSDAGQKAFEKYFNEGSVGLLVGTGNIGVKIDQALWDEDKVAVMPIPSDTPGEVGQTFAGGSNISLSANAQNPELGREALKIIFGEEFQRLLGANGWTPGNTTYADSVEGAFAEISGQVIENSKLTPNTPQWGAVNSNRYVHDFWAALAGGTSIDDATAQYGASIEETLNS